MKLLDRFFRPKKWDQQAAALARTVQGFGALEHDIMTSPMTDEERAEAERFRAVHAKADNPMHVGSQLQLGDEAAILSPDYAAELIARDAELGRLRAQNEPVAEAEETEEDAAWREHTEALDDTYHDRNLLVLLAADLADEAGYDVGVGFDVSGPEWPVIYIDLPDGQISYHVPKELLQLSVGMPAYAGKWDGHTTPEKQKRIEEFLRGASW